MEKYVRITKTLNDKGRFVKLSDIQTNTGLEEIISESPNSDWYKSLYSYTEAAYSLFAKEGSIAGYEGEVYSNRLVFDLDSVDLNKVKEEAIELLYRLQTAGVKVEESCKVWFSGNKGFHLEVLIDKEFTPDELKTICSNIATGLTTFDSTIYNNNRIFRLENTKHQKTGLYKIELEPYDLTELTIDQIKELAKVPSSKTYSPIPVKDLSFLDKFKTPITPKSIKQVIVDVDESGIRGLNEVDFTTCPKDKPRCIHLLEQGCMVPGVGQRNAVFLALCRYYMNRGLNKEACYGLLKGVARNNARLYPEAEPFSKDEIWKNIVSGTYASKGFKQIPGAIGSDPDNETLKFYCDIAKKYTSKPCFLHNHVQTTHSVVNIDEVADGFGKFAEEVDKNTVSTGINFIDKNMRIVTGTTTLLIGCTGSGKTSCALNILKTSNEIDQPSMLFSMDMHRNLIYQKLAQQCTDYTRDEIFDLYVKKDYSIIAGIKKAISENYGKTFFDFSKTLTIEQIRDKVFETEQKSGKKIKFVLIDYAGRISGPYSDAYANANYNALKSIELAEVTDTAVIIINQISRTTGSELVPLRTKRAAKDSGAWEESASNVITMWRPFYGAEERDDVLRMYLAKNRLGPELEQVLHFDGAKGIVRDMDFTELAQYNEIRGDKAEREYRQLRSKSIQ